LAKEKTLTLRCFIDHDVQEHIKGDPVRLRQVLLNLVGNAIKFTNEGEIFVSVTADEDQNQIRFDIADSGIGLSDEAIANLFKPFKQEDSSTTRKFGGTGLGLAISKQLVRLMGGDIGVSSNDTGGSTFWFTLPQEHTAELADRPSEEYKAIYLIQDNVISVADHCLTEYLGYSGIACELVETTGESEQAIAVLQGHLETHDAPDLIALDAKHQCARDILPWIKGQNELADTPLVSVGTPEPHHIKMFSTILDEPVRRAGLGRKMLQLLGVETEDSVTPVESMSDMFSAKVLVVDDNEVNVLVAQSMLNKLGITVTCASSGAEALSLVESEEFDLVLMDRHMPEMDGLETTQSIREREIETGSRLTIIALTAASMAEDKEECYAADMDDFMSKPYTFDALVETLSRWLPRESEIGKAA